MRHTHHSVWLLLLLSPLFGPAAEAQAVPNVQGASSYQGFHLPTVAGTLSYSVTVSGDVFLGYNGASGTDGFTSISGNLALLSSSKQHPFSMVYSGGYFADVTGNQPSTVFQNLALSQVLIRGRWIYTVSDAVSYLPQTATTGLSGVPGVGDTGTAPIDVGTGAGQGILTYDQSSVTNTVIGSVQRRLSPSTTLSGTGSYTIARFLDTSVNGALNSNQYSAGLNLSHRIDARNTLGGGYSYFRDSFPTTLDPTTQASLGLTPSISASSVFVSYNRQVSRRLSLFVSAGPQWTSIPSVPSPIAGETGTTSLNATITAGLSYTTKRGSASVGYFRGTNAGSGVITGANTDSLQASATRQLSRVWNASTSVSYARSSSLIALANSSFVTNGLSATGQVNRSIGRHLSAFGSYTVQRQSLQGASVTPSVFNGLSQVIAAGLTYSPGTIGRSRR